MKNGEMIFRKVGRLCGAGSNLTSHIYLSTPLR